MASTSLPPCGRGSLSWDCPSLKSFDSGRGTGGKNLWGTEEHCWLPHTELLATGRALGGCSKALLCERDGCGWKGDPGLAAAGPHGFQPLPRSTARTCGCLPGLRATNPFPTLHGVVGSASALLYRAAGRRNPRHGGGCQQMLLMMASLGCTRVWLLARP